MNNINLGDYILGKDCVWEIVAVTKSGTDTVYDVKPVTQPGDFLDDSPITDTSSKVMKGISRSHIRHLGEVVPKDSNKALEILFDKTR